MNREEAINIVRKNIPHLGIGSTEMTEALKELIPELRESDDERIRQDIFKFIDEQYPEAWKAKKSKMLAWLEKQKKPKPDIEICPHSIKSKSYSITGYPCEWSEEDEKMRSRILDIFACDQKHYLNETAWFKSLPERFNPQPNQEWSDEDELMRKRCIADLGYIIAYEPQYKVRYDAQIEWLKSLRPGWKPTDKQMKALQSAKFIYKDGLDNSAVASILESLYNDLKKL